jgi:hypothetical protein
MTTISRNAKCKGLLRDSYAFDYALKVTECCIHTRQVLSARCLFCVDKIQVEIASDKKAAKSRHDELINSTLVNTVTIYTDGSGITKKIGAAAHNQTLNETAHQHLGRYSEYNVYLMRHEPYFYVFDTALMIICVSIWTVGHPGMTLGTELGRSNLREK